MSTLREAHPYTATDPGSGVTADSLRVWQHTRDKFSTFVRAVVCSPTEAAGPAYADSPAGPVHPTMVLVDDLGRSLALNGLTCGYSGTGPRGAAQVLVAEGLLDTDGAADRVAASSRLDLVARPRLIDLTDPADLHRTQP